MIPEKYFIDVLVEIYDLVVEFLMAFWAWGLTVRHKL